MREKYGPALPPEQPEEERADPLPTHETACLKGHDGPILAVRFNRTGTYCLTCGKVSRALGVHLEQHHPQLIKPVVAGPHLASMESP